MFRGLPMQEFETENIICVDVADTKLLGEMKELGDKAELCIDHHISNTHYAKRVLVKPEYAAAAELVYDVVCALETDIDKDTANCLYTGIATDTGCFKYSNTTPQSHMIAAQRRHCRYPVYFPALKAARKQARPFRPQNILCRSALRAQAEAAP